MRSFRPYHLIMAFVSVSYIAILVLPYVVLVLWMMIFDRLLFPPPSEKLLNELVLWSFASSVVQNAVLFSVRYYVRRDCMVMSKPSFRLSRNSYILGKIPIL